MHIGFSTGGIAIEVCGRREERAPCIPEAAD